MVKEADGILSSWDFSRDISSDRVSDTSGNDHNGFLKQTLLEELKEFYGMAAHNIGRTTLVIIAPFIFIKTI